MAVFGFEQLTSYKLTGFLSVLKKNLGFFHEKNWLFSVKSHYDNAGVLAVSSQ